jgi:hypothetical protein
MNSYSLTHLSDGALLRDLAALATRDRAITAALLAHLAEVDERRLYVPAGYSSMYAYCVGELSLSEDAAAKRIQAGRAARQFPVLFMALADGRLHLTGLRLLAPHLTADNVNELVSAAARKSKSEIEEMLARRFPRPDLPPLIRALPAQEFATEHAPGHVGTAQTRVPQPSVPAEAPPAPRPKLSPLAPERFALQVTIGKATHDKLRYAQELLGHTIPSGDVAQVLDRALDALIARLEKRKFAATSRPRPGPARRRRPAQTLPDPTSTGSPAFLYASIPPTAFVTRVKPARWRMLAAMLLR